MIYGLRHLTTYRYARTVRSARCTLRLRPRDGDGQRVLDSTVAITPAPRSRLERRDFFGLDTISLVLDEPHETFAVEAFSRVAVERPPPPPPESGPGWEAVREAALALPSLGPDGPAHFQFRSQRVPLVPAVTDYARGSFSPGRSAYGAAVELMRRMRNDFKFDAKATTVSTPLAEAFALRAGVCQDFAHVMIAGCAASACPLPMSAATSARAHRRAARACAGPTPATPGSPCGAGRSSAGSASTPPTTASCRTTTSSWPAGATTAMSPRSTASSRRRRAEADGGGGCDPGG